MNNNIILRIDSEYDSSCQSILNLVKNLEAQLLNLKPFNIKENSIIDLSNLHYIDANLSIILYAYLKLLRDLTPVNLIIQTPKRQELDKLLSRNNFCSLWGGTLIEDEFKTIIKISENKNPTEAIKELITSVKPILKERFSNGYEDEFISSLGEVCVNAFTHGMTDGQLWIGGQFYPKKHELSLTIMNFGNTFIKNVVAYKKAKGEEIKDYKFISWALIEHNTTLKNSLGIGLARFNDIVNKYNSDLVIISGEEVYKRENGIIKDYLVSEVWLPGTIINIKFYLNEENKICKK